MNRSEEITEQLSITEQLTYIRMDGDLSVLLKARKRLIHTVYRMAYLGHLAFNFFIRPRARGAYIAVWWDGKILLIRNSYKSCYTLPCGGLNQGESAIAAARRELHEEVGLLLPFESFRLVSQQENRTEYKCDHIYLFEVHLSSPDPIKIDGREVVWSCFCSPKTAMKMPLFNPVYDYLKQHFDENPED